MKTIFFLLSLFTSLTGCGVGTVNIEQLQDDFSAIDSQLSGYSFLEKPSLYHSAEGGKALYYYDQEELKKIRAVNYGEIGKWMEEYYYKEGDLFFVSNKYYAYNAHIFSEQFDSTQTRVEKESFYFSPKGLALWLDKENKAVDPKSAEFLSKEKDILENHAALQIDEF